MWKEFPCKIVGFFGEAQGYSIGVVNKFITSCIEEFQALAHPESVRPLVHDYLGPESPALQELQMKVRLGWSLDRFRYLYLKVQGHASALLVSRRNEGDHRTINNGGMINAEHLGSIASGPSSEGADARAHQPVRLRIVG